MNQAEVGDAGPYVAGGDSTSRDAITSVDGELPNGWHMVIQELVQTESAYVNDIRDIIKGYYDYPIGSVEDNAQGHPVPFTTDERNVLFGNIGELASFNTDLKTQFERANGQPEEVAHCFLNNMEGFKIYATYCTNYVQAMDVFNLLLKRQTERSELYFQQCQQALGHNLPLDSFLLKPVQRILKYPLLLHSLIKQYGKLQAQSEHVRQCLLDAHTGMSNLAQYINAAKQAKEDKKRTADILDSVTGWEQPGRTGLICVEDQIRVPGLKAEPHHIYAFENVLLITKATKDCPALYRKHCLYSDISLADVAPDPCHFELHCTEERMDPTTPRASKVFPIMVRARSTKQKALWTDTLHERKVEDITAEVQIARDAGDVSPLMSPTSSSHKPRHTFIQVIAQVQRAASLNAHGGVQAKSPNLKIDLKAAKSDSEPRYPVPSVSKVERTDSTDIVYDFSQASTEGNRVSATRRKWEELISSARDASLESPPDGRRARTATISVMSSKEKARSPAFWRNFKTSLDKDVPPSDDKCSNISGRLSDTSCARQGAERRRNDLGSGSLSGTPVLDKEMMASDSLMLPSTVPSSPSPQLGSLMSHFSANNSSFASPPMSPSVDKPFTFPGKKGLKTRQQLKGVMKSASKLVSPKRHQSPLPTSPPLDNGGLALGAQLSAPLATEGELTLMPGCLSQTSPRENVSTDSESTTPKQQGLATTASRPSSGRMRSGTVSFHFKSWTQKPSNFAKQKLQATPNVGGGATKAAEGGVTRRAEPDPLSPSQDKNPVFSKKRQSTPVVFGSTNGVPDPYPLSVSSNPEKTLEKGTGRFGRFTERTRARRHTMSSCSKKPDSVSSNDF